MAGICGWCNWPLAAAGWSSCRDAVFTQGTGFYWRRRCPGVWRGGCMTVRDNTGQTRTPRHDEREKGSVRQKKIRSRPTSTTSLFLLISEDWTGDSGLLALLHLVELHHLHPTWSRIPATTMPWVYHPRPRKSRSRRLTASWQLLLILVLL